MFLCGLRLRSDHNLSNHASDSSMIELGIPALYLCGLLVAFWMGFLPWYIVSRIDHTFTNAPAVGTYPAGNFYRFEYPSDIGEESDCEICLESMTDFATAELKCGHKYHKQSIEMGLSSKRFPTCPTCRSIVRRVPVQD